MAHAEIVERPRSLRWLFGSKGAAYIWLVVRLWLGYEWLHAGLSKIFGSEKAGFWDGGAGVKGFAQGAIASHGPKGSGAVVYGWWVQFLRDVVVPNYSGMGKLVALGETLVGAALIVGFLTGLTAIFGLILNFTYLYSGVVSVNPTYVILGVLLVAAWRISGYYGADYFVLPSVARLVHRRRHEATPIAKTPELQPTS